MLFSSIAWGVSALLNPSASASADETHRSLTKDIVISQLFVHPIKSCRGISVDSSTYDQSGLTYDRMWLIIDAETNRFMTARELPIMVTIEPTIDVGANQLLIRVPLHSKGKGEVVLRTPLNPSSEFLDKCQLIEPITIWATKDQSGYAVSREADDALSLFFGKAVRLVRKGPRIRPSGPDTPEVVRSVTGAKKQYDQEQIRFQDFYPILLASQASLEHVRKSILASVYPSVEQSGATSQIAASDSEEEIKVKGHRVPDAVNREYWSPERIETMEMRRFRPNIIVDSVSGSPQLTGFEEDDWSHVEIFPSSDAPPPYGSAAEGLAHGIYCMTRCMRCQVPCIDTDSGHRDAYLPSRVLQAYRRIDPSNKMKACFGMLSTPRETSGTLTVGDIVRVTRAQKRPIALENAGGTIDG